MTESVRVRAPASCANLGPGFDMLAVAVDVHNELTVTAHTEALVIEIDGLGAGELPTDQTNLMARGLLAAFGQANLRPPGLLLQASNRIPLNSGLGSSAAAIVAGLVAGNALLPQPLPPSTLLELAAGLEGHADNVAACLNGGLVAVVQERDSLACLSLPIAPLKLVFALPTVSLSTHEMRAALPRSIEHRRAVRNQARIPFLLDALERGDLTQLAWSVRDELHEPFRMARIPGALAARAAALEAGATAVVLSGAGPGVLAILDRDEAPVVEAMTRAFERAGVDVECLPLSVATTGAAVQE